jgi:hypothetical protein
MAVAPILSIETQGKKHNKIVRDTMVMISAAYQAYRMEKGDNSSMTFTDLLPYLNYVSTAASGTLLDENPGETGPFECWSEQPCVRLHNGAALFYNKTVSFGGTSSLNAIWVQIDPDGVFRDSSTSNAGPSKAVHVRLYYDGTLRTLATVIPGTCDSEPHCEWSANASWDPAWFTKF